MGRIGLYLSGAGSLDGSDAMASLLAYEALQECGFEPVAVGRDVNQGRVVDHRTAQSQQGETRNALAEAARLVRGDIRDMRDVDPEKLAGAILVGGDGTLSTWTDYHRRGQDCRVTERLKYHILDLTNQRKTIICLGNAGFVLGQVFRERDSKPQVNVGSNSHLNDTLRGWGIELTESSPAWDEASRVACLPEVTRGDDLPRDRERLTDLFRERL